MLVMKKFIPGLALILSLSAFGQKADVAIGTYAENGKLISVTNLSALSDCTARSAEGKVSSVRVEGDRARVRLRNKKVDTADVNIPLERLARDEREAIFHDLVKKQIILRVAGYSCEPDAGILAFSIDRVY